MDEKGQVHKQEASAEMQEAKGETVVLWADGEPGENSGFDGILGDSGPHASRKKGCPTKKMWIWVTNSISFTLPGP